MCLRIGVVLASDGGALQAMLPAFRLGLGGPLGTGEQLMPWVGVDDVAGLPPTVISVNECDPLRDEGIAFYRTLLAAGVPARCVTVMGTMHAVEAIPNVCPEISRAAARDIVGHAG